MDLRSRRLIVALTALLALALMPATASADCNGPGCDSPPVVDGAAIAMTIVIVLAFFAAMAVTEIRRR